MAAAGCLNSAGREKQLAAASSRAAEHLHGLGNFEGSWLFSLQEGAESHFFEWQAGYVVALIKGGHVSEDSSIDLVLVTLSDHEQAFKSITRSVRYMKKSVNSMTEDLKTMKAAMVELNDLKKMKEEFVDIKKSMDDLKLMTDDLKLMKKQLQKLKGSKTWIWNMALVFLLLGFIG